MSPRLIFEPPVCFSLVPLVSLVSLVSLVPLVPLVPLVSLVSLVSLAPLVPLVPLVLSSGFGEAGHITGEFRAGNLPRYLKGQGHRIWTKNNQTKNKQWKHKRPQ